MRTHPYIAQEDEQGVETLQNQYIYNLRDGAVCDIVMQGVTKASGMRELLKYWNKDMSQVIAFGDSRNFSTVMKTAFHI